MVTRTRTGTMDLPQIDDSDEAIATCRDAAVETQSGDHHVTMAPGYFPTGKRGSTVIYL